ncbi:AraC family transcriptional regulator [Phreatobacter sp.]|uniref:AraC family transcriptional regulator n=1 Tax=Phreatobacter sp. TaxID=1966341 RepID=UPI003F72107A
MNGIRTAPFCAGIERIEACFTGHAYDPHRHDTYAIGVTLSGVQSFTYRGSGRDSLAGQAIVLHPDEVHDGRCGGGPAFAYRMAYVEPRLIGAALAGLGGGPGLPFIASPVTSDARVVSAAARMLAAIDREPEPLEADQIVLALARSLAAVADDALHPACPKVDGPAIDRVRDYLEAGRQRVVTSCQLEAVGGMDRWQLARQFRLRFGTSPYRYLTMRRLDAARAAIIGGAGLAEAAHAAGFADQSHMTRQFRSAFGLSPGRWRSLLLR